MRSFISISIMLTASVILLAACGGNDTSSAATLFPANLVQSTFEGAVLNINQAMTTAQEGERIAVAGVIGGHATPFLRERSVFFITVDATESCCPAGREGVITVQVLDEAGQPYRESLSGYQGLRVGSHVIIDGVVARTDENTLVITAEHIAIQSDV